MSEDLPDPDCRVLVEGERVRLNWKRTNVEALRRLLKRVRETLRQRGYPIVLTQCYNEENLGHQCGTIRIGLDPATSPLDSYCRAYDQTNLFVVDGSFLPNSTAVSPSLTIIAQAMRVSSHIRNLCF